MTCKEKLIADHPEWTEERIDYRLHMDCPSNYGYLDDPKYGCGDSCSDCWNREIPENIDAPRLDPNEVTKLDELATKKEKEEMKACEYTCEELTRLYAELKNTRERLAEVTECYAESLKERDELKTKMKRLNETNEDLANKLAEARAETERVTDAWKACTELRDSMNEKIVELEHTVLERDTEIEYKQEFLDQVCDKNRWLNDQLDAKNKHIQELCARIDKMSEAEYAKQDIEATKRVFEFFKQSRPIVTPNEEPTIRPINELSYARYANHIRMKYKALTDNGFSHDDAMSLIPMWTD